MTIGSQVGVQLLGIVVTGIYAGILTFGLLKLVGILTSGLRVTEDEEQVGLDITDHDEKGYAI